MNSASGPARRPLKTRERRWARALAVRLAAWGVRPNAVSAASVVFAAGAGTLLAFSLEKNGDSRAPLLVGAAACVQLRLLCNMLDGLIAVEGGFASRAGEVWNDLPDRIADPLVLIGAGLAVRRLPGGVPLGWLAALLALLTAYVRMLGGALRLPQSFAGPMAKPQRLFVHLKAPALSHREKGSKGQGAQKTIHVRDPGNTVEDRHARGVNDHRSIARLS